MWAVTLGTLKLVHYSGYPSGNQTELAELSSTDQQGGPTDDPQFSDPPIRLKRLASQDGKELLL